MVKQAGGSSQARSARDRLAAERRAAEEAARRRRVMGIAAALLAVVLAIVGVMALATTLNKPAPTPGGAFPSPEVQLGDGSFVKSLTSVPASTFDAVGAGSVTRVAGQAIPGGAAQVEDGKPRVLYVGAEFCPFCALERWPLTIALSRFGSFEGLKPALSSPDEKQLSNIPTVSYLGQKFTSSVLVFDSYETSDRFGKPLQKIDAADQALLDKYDPGKNGNPIPWVYWGTGHQSGASFADYQLLAGKNAAEVAGKLADPTTPEAKAIIGAANVHTAQLCRLTNNQPANVCNSTGVQNAAKVLG